MVNAAERHRELVACFATERAWLRGAKMMGVRGLAATDKAGLRGNELAMGFVANAPRFADRKLAFVDAATEPLPGLLSSPGSFWRIVGVLWYPPRPHGPALWWQPLGVFSIGVRSPGCAPGRP